MIYDKLGYLEHPIRPPFYIYLLAKTEWSLVLAWRGVLDMFSLHFTSCIDVK